MARRNIVALVLCIAAFLSIGAIYRSPSMPFFTHWNCSKLRGDGTHDDTAALNACLSLLPSGETLYLHGNYYVTDTISIAGKQYSRVGCTQRGNHGSCGIYWHGPHDDRAVLDLDGVASFTLSNIVIETGDTTTHHVAKRGVQLRNTGATGITTTDVRFDEVSVIQIDNFANTPADYVAIDINPDGANNVENVKFLGGTIACGFLGGVTDIPNFHGTGIELGHNFNQKGNHILWTTISSCAIGVGGDAPSVSAIGLQMQSNAVAFSLDGTGTTTPFDGCRVEDTDGENNRIFFLGGNCLVANNRINADVVSSGRAVVEAWRSNRYLELRGNRFGAIAAGTMHVACYGDGSGGTTGIGSSFYAASTIVMSGNQGLFTNDGTENNSTYFGNVMSHDLAACAWWSSTGDTWYDQADAISHAEGQHRNLTGLATPTAGALMVDYNQAAASALASKYVFSEDGNPYEAVRPGADNTDPGCTAAHDVGKLWISAASTSVWKRCTKTGGTIGWATF